MIRRIPVFVCLLGLLAAGTVQARPHYRTFDGRFHHISWGGATSSGDIRVTGLPAVQGARESARLKAQPGSLRTAPGERLNRPKFGSGKSAASGRLTGKRQYKPIVITKPVDKATPMLRQAHRSRRMLPQVVLRGRDSTGKFLTFKLRRVFVTSYSMQGLGDRAMEQVTLVFEQIEWRQASG